MPQRKFLYNNTNKKRNRVEGAEGKMAARTQGNWAIPDCLISGYVSLGTRSELPGQVLRSMASKT